MSPLEELNALFDALSKSLYLPGPRVIDHYAIWLFTDIPVGFSKNHTHTEMTVAISTERAIEIAVPSHSQFRYFADHERCVTLPILTIKNTALPPRDQQNILRILKNHTDRT